MSDLRLGRKRDRGYGTYFEGKVEAEDRSIDVALREPAKSGTGVAYVMVNGLTATKLSMRGPAHEAVKANNAAVTFEWTNKGRKNALDENAKDLASVIIAFSQEDYIQRILALSMGGRVATRSLLDNEVSSQVESATLVAPAGYLARDPSKCEVFQHFAATAPEIVGMSIRHPRQALYLGSRTVRHLFERAPAVIGELGELVKGNEHDTIHEIKLEPNAPHMRLMYGDNDPLIPAWAFEASIPELPFDEIMKYKGGHTTLVDTPQLSQQVYELDAALSLTRPLSMAA